MLSLLFAVIVALCSLCAAQTQNPVFLPTAGTVSAPPANAILKADGSNVNIFYNGVAAEGFESTRLELYLLTVTNGLSAPGVGNISSGYQRFGGLPPLANLPPNAFQNGTSDSLKNDRRFNAYNYTLPLPINSEAGKVPANLTFLEFYHSPDDQGLVWVTLNYHPVLIDASGY